MNTTAGATNPPMPPADLGGWTPHGVSGRAWRSGPFVIGTTPPDQGEHEWTWRAQMALDGGGEGWLDLGRFHPESGSAISACRGVANALQEARRHDEPAPSADHHPPRRRWMKRRA